MTLDDTCESCHYEDNPLCQTCGGDGFEECETSDTAEGCCDGLAHTCPNCGGSGLQKDQRFW